MEHNTKAKDNVNSDGEVTEYDSQSISEKAYLNFVKLHRKKFVNANPNASRQALNKIMTEAFLQLDWEEKTDLQSQVEKLPKQTHSRPRKLFCPSALERTPDGKYKKKATELSHKRAMRNIFSRRYRSKIMKANRHIPISVVNKMVPKAYQSISEDEKEKLSQEAHELLETMARSASKFRGDIQRGRAEAKKRQPKKQHGVFPLFFKLNRHKIVEENPGLTNQQIMKKAGEMYRNLDEGEKDQVRRKAQQLRNDVRVENVPSQPPSSFMLFTKEKMAAYSQKFPYKSNQDIMELIGWEWRITPNNIKEKFKNESKKGWANHRIAMQLNEESDA